MLIRSLSPNNSNNFGKGTPAQKLQKRSPLLVYYTKLSLVAILFLNWLSVRQRRKSKMVLLSRYVRMWNYVKLHLDNFVDIYLRRLTFSHLANTMCMFYLKKVCTGYISLHYIKVVYNTLKGVFQTWKIGLIILYYQSRFKQLRL